jgi:hydroxymethylpyrimidine/phosphomethylpyrimidine kinase
MKTVLTIAGFDPSSGAGVTADLMVFAAHGLFGTSCITGLTVQSTVGVVSSTAVSAEIVRDTLDCLESDLPAAGIKIGMLASAANVRVVVDFLSRLRGLGFHGLGLVGKRARVPVVLDPVLRSSSGRELLDGEGVSVMRERLLPLVDWVTPNLEEAGVLLGRSVRRRDDMVEAARGLQAMGLGLNVVVTGGNLNPPDDLLLGAGGNMVGLTGQKIVSQSTHGTGCAFSSALLSRIVLGDDGKDAALRAKEYVAEGIRSATAMGKGVGPLNHLWPVR